MSKDEDRPRVYAKIDPRLNNPSRTFKPGDIVQWTVYNPDSSQGHTENSVVDEDGMIEVWFEATGGEWR